MFTDATCDSRWSPPHCPNSNCPHHNPLRPGWRYKKIGFYTRRLHPHRIQRYRCHTCGVTFSSQTFSITYWQKRPDLTFQLFTKTVGCMANRQAARDLHASPTAIDHHLERLGRHCLLFHQRMMQQTVLQGDLVVDGFESFEFSQYHPIHHHVAVEASSSFFIYFTDSELRRKGRMTDHQKRRRAELEATLGRPDPKAIEKDMAELLRVSLRGRRLATVCSDDHRAYPRSMRRVDCRIDHRITSSKDRRDSGNPLWEANLLDLLIRHGSANHKRETIAWSKRRQASAERLAILLVWRNYVKRRWERGPPQTPAMIKGLTDHPLSVEEILSERIFPAHVELPPRWRQYYERRVETRALKINRHHTLRYAF